MKVKIRKIKYDKFDDVMDNVINDSLTKKKVAVNLKYIEENSEDVIIDGKEIYCDFSINKYESISGSDNPNYMKTAEIAALLHKEFVDINNTYIPKNVYYEKEVWTYLSLTVFLNVIIDLKIKKSKNFSYDLLSRVLFSISSLSKMDRTCLMFYWIYIDCLKSENDKEITITAFHYLDAIRDIFERVSMSKNDYLLRAYVEAMLKFGNPKQLASDEYRSFIPSNLSCYYAATSFDSMSYQEVVNLIAKQFKEIVSLSN